MKKQFVWLLRAGLALAVLGGCGAAFWFAPSMGKELASALPEYGYMFWPCLGYIWGLFALYFTGIYQGFVIVGNIAGERSFTEENAKRLMLIAKLAFACSVLIGAGEGALFCMNLLHPGMFLLCTAVAAVGLVLAVAAATLSHLTEKAAALQSDSDLTV